MIDIVSGPGAKADMVQSNPVLNETLAVVFGTTRLDANCRAGADEVGHVAALENTFKAEHRHQPRVEFPRFVILADGQYHMRHSVDLNHVFPLRVVPR